MSSATVAADSTSYRLFKMKTSKSGPVVGGAFGLPPIGAGGATPSMGMAMGVPLYVPLATGLQKTARGLSQNRRWTLWIS
jgi:hypothetical protein